MTIQTRPAIGAQTTISLLLARLDSWQPGWRWGGCTTAMGWIPLQVGRFTVANFMTGGVYNCQLWLDKQDGAGLLERQFFAAPDGWYPSDDSYRDLYFEVGGVSGSTPLYPAITAGNAVGRDRAVPTGSSAGWVGEIRLGVPSSFAPATRAVNNTAVAASMFDDPSTGEIETEWRNFPERMGRTNAIIMTQDTTYLSKCGADTYQLTLAEEETAATYPGTTAEKAALAAAMVTMNDNHARYNRDMWWNNVRGETAPLYPNASHWTAASITNAAFPAAAGYIADLTNAARGDYGVNPTWVGTPPPTYGNQRQVLGLILSSGQEFDYYDRPDSFDAWYRKTGDFEYVRRSFAIAFAYSWAMRYDTLAGDHVIQPAEHWTQMWKFQPLGLAVYARHAGHRPTRDFLEGAVTHFQNYPTLGESITNGEGEPRPVSRTLSTLYRAAICTRPTDRAYDWRASTQTAMTSVLTGTTRYDPDGLEPFGFGGTYRKGLPAPGPQGDYWVSLAQAVGVNYAYARKPGGQTDNDFYDALTLEQVTPSTFFQPIMSVVLAEVVEEVGMLLTADRETAKDAAIQSMRWTYRVMFDGSPEDHPLVPQPGASPSIKAIFTGDFALHGVPEDRWTSFYARPDLIFFYCGHWAWAAWQAQSAELATLARRLFYNGFGNEYFSGAKQTQETFHFHKWIPAALAAAPAPGAVSYDVAASVQFTGTAAGTSVGGIVSPPVVARDARGWKMDTALTIVSSNTAVATVTNTRATTAKGTVTTARIAAVGIGVATITATDPATGLSDTFVIGANAAQVDEPWSTNTIRSSLWTVTTSGAAVAPSAATGALVMGHPATFSAATERVTSLGRFSLDAGPVAMTLVTTSAYLASTYIVLRDASGKGFGFSFFMPGGIRTIRSSVQTGGSESSASGGQAMTTPIHLRIRKLTSTNFIAETSADGDTWTGTEGNASGYVFPVGTVTSAMELSLEVLDPGLGAILSLTVDDILWSDTTPPAVGSASKIAITSQPSSTGVSGVALASQPVVWVEDSSNALVASDTSTVTASLNLVSGSLALSGTTSRAAVAGVVAFTDLTLTGTGSGTLTFSDGALTPITSSTIIVAAPLPFRGRRFFF